MHSSLESLAQPADIAKNGDETEELTYHQCGFTFMNSIARKEGDSVNCRWWVTIAATLVIALTALCQAPAHAYPTYTGSFTCDQCHATGPEGSDWDGSGPHKGYATTTRKCVVCHTVHVAPADSVLLLQGATVSAACLHCHDGTGGVGVYATIAAYGGSVAASHSCDTTSVVPGGSQPLSGPLSCADCHSAHGSSTVVPFLRDSGRAFAADEYVYSDCLLRSDVNTSVSDAYPVYGARWCAACHDERHSDSSSTVNHPVEPSMSFGYGDVTSTVTADSWRLYDPGVGFAVGMGRTNAGYLMAPVPEAGDGRIEARRPPICQQCHEDARDVESVFSADYTHRGTDPWNVPINPEFTTFPHQTTNPYMTVERGDDLCMNCHETSSLP